MSDFATKLKELRLHKGMTQRELAELLHVSQNAIFNWENGKREPSSDMIEKIADSLDVLPSYLMGWRDQDIEIDRKIDELIDIIRSGNVTQNTVYECVSQIRQLSSKQKSIEKQIHDIDFSAPIKPNTIAAHFDDTEFTEDELDEIRQFAEFVKSKRKKED